MIAGRPRKFDESKVLEKAMQVFWSKGYEATSVADLVAATGLHKGSLYQAFGDKHGIFCLCLESYLKKNHNGANEIMQSETSPAKGLCKALESFVDSADDPNGAMRGCLAVNTMVELAPHDEKIRDILSQDYRRFISLLSDTITRAQVAGEIDTAHTPELKASMLMTMMCGLASSTKGPLSTNEGRQILNEQLKLLGLLSADDR